MTLSEFHAWLDGFEASINGAPNEDQWAKIKAKLATVSDGVVSAPRQFIRDDGIMPTPNVTPRRAGEYVSGFTTIDGKSVPFSGTLS